MIKIYTSYFSGIKKFNLNIEDCVSISLYPPKGIKIKYFSKLFPTKEILADYKNGVINEDEYRERYMSDVLSKLDPQRISKILDGKILVCYERPNTFCHRVEFSKWMNDSGFAIVEEITEKRI